LLNETVGDRPVGVRWHYTPMMTPFSRKLASACVVYDCMDELANFKFAPPELPALERELMTAADVVFTGGYSLYEAKQATHADIHPFRRAWIANISPWPGRTASSPPTKPRWVGPRLGFYGVIDERMDLALLEAMADARPDWTLVLVGPVVKIDPAMLPRRPNIAYLGSKTYAELPDYLAGWDVALMPFAINESTRFISPTKTPEYLAGGRPVVSTPITDVVRHYGGLDAVRIAGDAETFIAACAAALADAQTPEAWLPQVDSALSALSWDETFRGMRAKIDAAVATRARRSTTPAPAPLLRPATGPAFRIASRNKPFDYAIVGAGFAGSVLAERLAAGLDKRVLLIDRRPHIGGNAYDEHDAQGVLIHRYGPHIFHTNSDDVAAYLSRFTHWRPYEHRVLAQSTKGLVPIPINRTTLNALYGAGLDSDEAAARFLAARAEPVSRSAPPRTWSSRRSGAISMSDSSKAIPASNGAWIRRSWTSRSPPGCRRASTLTTGISPTASRPCRRRATPGCSRPCSTIPTSPSKPAWIGKTRGATPSTTTSSIPARSTNISTSSSAPCPIAACVSAMRRWTASGSRPSAP
jgi:UDP-galactopyranose mutase